MPTPDLEWREEEVARYFTRGEFNPNSKDQIIAKMQDVGEMSRPGHKSKTNAPSTDKTVIGRLASRHKFFRGLQSYRKASKVKSTYVNVLNAAVASPDGRMHPFLTHNTSTWRMASYDPNIQNWPNDEDDPMTVALRNCVVAADGCTLVSADYSSIEAVETGWWADDKDYIRLATRGVHSYLVAHKVGEPVDLSVSDDELAAHLADIKKRFKAQPVYAGLKKTVHLTNYGGTPYMMHMTAPELFPSILSAQKEQDFYLQLLPKLKPWHKSVRARAAQQNFLGGKDHPYKFKHWFWDVVAWNPKRNCMGPGSDWNRVIAYYPQSTASGVLMDTVLDLSDPASENYVGDLYYGDTPLRALIHDEILAEVPDPQLPTYLERLRRSMLRPVHLQPIPPQWQMGSHLRIDADIRVGRSWGDMKAA